MNFDELNDSNFVMYAMKNYENPTCTGMEEFHEDLNRVKYIKRLLKRNKNTGASGVFGSKPVGMQSPKNLKKPPMREASILPSPAVS